jgi:hypothetical protein
VGGDFGGPACRMSALRPAGRRRRRRRPALQESYFRSAVRPTRYVIKALYIGTARAADPQRWPVDPDSEECPGRQSEPHLHRAPGPRPRLEQCVRPRDGRVRGDHT